MAAAPDTRSSHPVFPSAPAPAAPTMLELMALIKAQGEEIAALKRAPVAETSRPRAARPTLPDGPPWSIRVRATRMGFYPEPGLDGSRGRTHVRRFGRSETHPGDEFFLEKPEDFSPGPMGWMELASVKGTVVPIAPPTTAVKPVQDPLMGIQPAMAPRIIES